MPPVPHPLREANLAAVVRAVLEAEEPLSRAGVAQRLALSRSTAARLCDELVGAGLLAELGLRAGPGRGRPSTPLAASPGVVAVGLQVGTAFLVARAVDLRGEVVDELRVEAELRGSDAGRTLRRLRDLGARLVARLGAHPVGAGVALPGIVDAGSGRLLRAPNLGWTDLPVRERVLERLVPGGVHVVGNEADLAAQAFVHRRPGVVGEVRDFLYLSGETGIGGAAVRDAAVLAGQHGWAGEVGHVCVDPHGPDCPCGSNGCLELYAGRRALLDAEDRADPAVDRAASALAVALTGAVNLLDVDTVVLGGHLAHLGDALVRPLEAELARRVLSARWVRPRVLTDTAGDSSAATGAALRVLDTVVGDPAGWLRERGDARRGDRVTQG